MRNVVYSTDYRGNDDDELFLVFKGIGREELREALSVLVPSNGQGVCRQMVFTVEHTTYRNGTTPHRVAVQIIDRNEDFCSLDDLLLLVEARIKAEHGYNIKKVPINTFINL